MERLRSKRAKIRQRLQRRHFRKELIELDEEFENEHQASIEENAKIEDTSRKSKLQLRDSVVTILLVKAKNLPLGHDSRELTDAHIKFKLGNEKYKSKSSWTERWLEQFDLHLFDDEQILELALWNRNTLYGKARIDLSLLQRETTHGIWQAFEDCPGEVFLLLTVSGTTALEIVTDLKAHKDEPEVWRMLHDSYKWHRSLENLRDVGHLEVKVYGATGLAATEIVMKSDPFCVLELGNARLQTKTERRTLTPTWNKVFTFNVKDMTQCLEVTVYDEHRDHRMEFLGKVTIPLLRIKNGVKHWYTLKNKTLFAQAKGNSPQILLEMTIEWSAVRAVCRVLQPKEEKLIQQEIKFKRQIFLRNVRRLKNVAHAILDAVRYLQSCFEWESPLRSAIAFVLWVLISWYGNLEMIPLVLLLLILKKWSIHSALPTADHYNICDEKDEDDDDDVEEWREEKRTLKERLQRMQEVSLTLQNSIGNLASLGERIKNTFNFSVPLLTWFAAFVFLIAFLILHFIPFRYILLSVGLVCFIRPILRPNRMPNRLFYFLSRVSDDVELLQYRELQPTPKK